MKKTEEGKMKTVSEEVLMSGIVFSLPDPRGKKERADSSYIILH